MFLLDLEAMFTLWMHQKHDPWDLYIYLHEWLIYMVNAGKYTIHGSYGILGECRMSLFLRQGFQYQLVQVFFRWFWENLQVEQLLQLY